MRKLKVKRVGYGRSDTPVELREYVSPLSSAVGTKSDWEAFAKQNGYDGVEVQEQKQDKKPRCKGCGEELVGYGGAGKVCSNPECEVCPEVLKDLI